MHSMRSAVCTRLYWAHSHTQRVVPALCTMGKEVQACLMKNPVNALEGPLVKILPT